MKEHIEKINSEKMAGFCPKCGISEIMLTEKVTLIDPQGKLPPSERVKYKYISLCCNIVWSEKNLL